MHLWFYWNSIHPSVTAVCRTAVLTLCLSRTMSWERRMRPQSFPGCTNKQKTHIAPAPDGHVTAIQIERKKSQLAISTEMAHTSSLVPACMITGKPLWLVVVILRMSTMVPTFSILLKQVTGELMTSLLDRREHEKKKTLGVLFTTSKFWQTPYQVQSHRNRIPKTNI